MTEPIQPNYPVEPSPDDIDALNRKVRRFVDDCLADAPNLLQCQVRFSEPFSAKPFRFSIFIESEEAVYLDHIDLDCFWRGKGIFSSLWRYLESKPQLKLIGVDRADTDSIQNRMEKLGVPAVANAYILRR